MALVKSILKNELQAFCNENAVNFSGYPGSFEEAAGKWSKAFDSYARGVTPISTTSVGAKSAFEVQFLASKGKEDISFLKSCFAKYVQVLATGMAPLFIATPPNQGALNLEIISTLGLNGGSSEACLDSLCTLIDTWMRTGIAVNSISGITTTWI